MLSEFNIRTIFKLWNIFPGKINWAACPSRMTEHAAQLKERAMRHVVPRRELPTRHLLAGGLNDSAVRGLTLHGLDCALDIGPLREELQGLLFGAGECAALAPGLGGPGAGGHQLVAGHIALVDDELGEPGIGLEQLVVRVLGVVHGGGHHGLLLALGSLALGALDDLGHDSGSGLTPVTGLPPGHIGQAAESNLLAGLVGHGAAVGDEEAGADALDFLAVDGVLVHPDLAGAVVDGPLQSVHAFGLPLAILPGAEGDAVQLIGVLLGRALDGHMLQRPQADDVVLGEQRPAAAGALQTEAEAVLGVGVRPIVLNRMKLNEGDAVGLGQDFLGRPLTRQRGHVGGVLGNAVVHHAQVGDAGILRQGKLQLLARVGGGIVHGAGGDVPGVGQSAVTLHAVGGQVHQDVQDTGGLALLRHDVGRGGAVLRLLPGQGHGQLGGVAHHITGDVGARPQLGVQNLQIDAVSDALPSNGSHRSGAAQGHGLDRLSRLIAVLVGERGQRVGVGFGHDDIFPFI